MTDLELALRELDVDWPATPDIAAAVSARLAGEAAPRGAARPRGGLGRLGLRRRLALAGAALLLLAAGTTLAVPEARSTVFRWLGIESVEIRRDPATPTPGASLGLGLPTTVEELRAQRIPVLIPDALDGPPGVYATSLPEGPRAASLVYDGPLLVQTFQARATPFIEKTVSTGSQVERLEVDGAMAYWIAGSHGFAYQTADGVAFEPARVAGNTLLVDRNDGLLLRVEGDVTRERAVEIARSVE